MTRPRLTIAPRRSVALFAILAILMVIASYIVIVALAAACVYLPYLVLTTTINFQVFQLMQEMANGKIGRETWEERCKEFGIAGALLCPLTAEKTGGDAAAAMVEGSARENG